jgi:hypothetical protein
VIGKRVRDEENSIDSAKVIADFGFGVVEVSGADDSGTGDEEKAVRGRDHDRMIVCCETEEQKIG